MLKIIVMGSGGIGGYFGARLAQVGHSVVFVARGAHLAAMQRDGLKIESSLGNLHLQPTSAIGDPRETDAADAVIFAVKMGDTKQAAAALKPILRTDTPIFTFQNGVEATGLISEIVGNGHVVPGVARIASHIANPGTIVHASPFARLEFAEIGSQPSQRSERFHTACREAGIDAELSPDIDRALWMKFAMLASMSGVTTLIQRPVGPLRTNAETRSLIEAAIREAVRVGEAAGDRLQAADAESIIQTIDALPEAMTSSMSHDRAAGKPLELHWLSGAVVRLGERHDVPTPTHRFIVRALALEAAGRA